jgi:hypothetical protein
MRVTRQLLDLGFQARVLEGGFDAWKAEFPLEAKGTPALPPTPATPIALEV